MATEALFMSFLEKKLPFSVAAYAKYLYAHEERDKNTIHAWALKENGAIQGAIVRSGSTVYPVFNDEVKNFEEILSFFFEKNSMDAARLVFHGKARDIELLERYAEERGLQPGDRIIYDFMTTADTPPLQELRASPPGLIIRQPGVSDIDRLFPLQAGYEQEEVLPKNGKFDPAVCRMLLERLVKHERILIAELGGRIVGKINTNAETPSWAQIGGVYVHPSYRKRGIATRMTAIFVQGLLEEGRRASLFVKKEKPATRDMYGRVGFKVVGDYRITYY
ncbi:MAG: GNAT family N-acetyltransferase [Treponema sp.]|nr:GNAT family N-acetyltransferase [Treponema sp.]